MTTILTRTPATRTSQNTNTRTRYESTPHCMELFSIVGTLAGAAIANKFTSDVVTIGVGAFLGFFVGTCLSCLPNCTTSSYDAPNPNEQNNYSPLPDTV